MKGIMATTTKKTTTTKTAAKKKLGFPEGYSCVGTCALGYADKEFPKLKGEGQRLEVKILR